MLDPALSLAGLGKGSVDGWLVTPIPGFVGSAHFQPAGHNGAGRTTVVPLCLGQSGLWVLWPTDLQRMHLSLQSHLPMTACVPSDM